MTETFDEVNKTCKVSLNSSYKYSFVRPQAEIERKEPITIDVSNINAQLILSGSMTPVSEDDLTHKNTVKSVSFNCSECGNDVEQDVTFDEVIGMLEGEPTCICCTDGEHDIDDDDVRDQVSNFSTCSGEIYGEVECNRCHQEVSVSLKVEVNP